MQHTHPFFLLTLFPFLTPLGAISLRGPPNHASWSWALWSEVVEQHITCLLVIQGPGTESFPTQPRVVVNGLRAGILLLHLPMDGKEEAKSQVLITPDSTLPVTRAPHRLVGRARGTLPPPGLSKMSHRQ